MRHLYIVSYDISDPKRWRQVYRTMRGYGEHLQLSVFQCDLTPIQRVKMEGELNEIIHHEEDQVIFVDLGPTEGRPISEIQAIGREMKVLERGPVIV